MILLFRLEFTFQRSVVRGKGDPIPPGGRIPTKAGKQHAQVSLAALSFLRDLLDFTVPPRTASPAHGPTRLGAQGSP